MMPKATAIINAKKAIKIALTIKKPLIRDGMYYGGISPRAYGARETGVRLEDYGYTKAQEAAWDAAESERLKPTSESYSP